MISIPQVLLPLVLSLVASASAETGADGVHPMAGQWQFNEELSENPRDAMHQRRGGRRGGAAGRGGGGGRGGAVGGGFGSQQPRGQAATRGRRASGERGGQGGPRGPALELSVSVSADSFQLTADERPQQTFALGEEVADGVAAVDGDGFVVQSETPRGDVITRKFTLAKKGQRLKIKTSLPPRGDGEPIEFTTVYDRVENE